MIAYVLATSFPILSKFYETVTEIYASMHMHSNKCLQVYYIKGIIFKNSWWQELLYTWFMILSFLTIYMFFL